MQPVVTIFQAPGKSAGLRKSHGRHAFLRMT
jgi:hypothetical protein